SLTLDTRAPSLALSSPTSGPVGDGTLLSGTAEGTGSAITALSYHLDSGTEVPIAIATDGSFSQVLDLSRLAVGNHPLTMTARDAGGNVTHDAMDVVLAAPLALTLSSVAPTDGANEVGLTFRPKVVFSRPIDVSALNGSDFYLTDPSGDTVPTTIV